MRKGGREAFLGGCSVDRPEGCPGGAVLGVAAGGASGPLLGLFAAPGEGGERPAGQPFSAGRRARAVLSCLRHLRGRPAASLPGGGGAGGRGGGGRFGKAAPAGVLWLLVHFRRDFRGRFDILEKIFQNSKKCVCICRKMGYNRTEEPFGSQTSSRR